MFQPVLHEATHAREEFERNTSTLRTRSQLNASVGKSCILTDSEVKQVSVVEGSHEPDFHRVKAGKLRKTIKSPPLTNRITLHIVADAIW